MTMTSRTQRILTIPAAALLLAGGLTACGDDGPKLSEKQQSTASRLESVGHLSKKDAECIAGKLSGEALSVASTDADFSELNGASEGETVAAAYSSCTGKNFENEYHYDPKG